MMGPNNCVGVRKLTPTYRWFESGDALSTIGCAGCDLFFTVNLAERSNTLLVDYVAVLREAVRVVKQRHPFYIDAFVVLPDHLHAIWTLPEPVGWGEERTPT
jgi:hypothetical protein